jgi:hypothetical protein
MMDSIIFLILIACAGLGGFCVGRIYERAAWGRLT